MLTVPLIIKQSSEGIVVSLELPKGDYTEGEIRIYQATKQFLSTYLSLEAALTDALVLEASGESAKRLSRKMLEE